MTRIKDATVSATIPDWTREACGVTDWLPAQQLLRALRQYENNRDNGLVASALRTQAIVAHRFWSAVTGADIPLGCHIAGGLLLPHPNGVVIHPAAIVGPNCLLFQQTTLGTGGPKPGAPVLDGHVDIGAGAKILGGVHIGAHAVIAANAVVLNDVPAGATAVGAPARVVDR
jgi:serine O-acetyltransferase